MTALWYPTPPPRLDHADRTIGLLVGVVLPAVFALLFIGAVVAALLEPSADITDGRCYRVEARHGPFGYMAGARHIEIACP